MAVAIRLFREDEPDDSPPKHISQLTGADIIRAYLEDLAIRAAQGQVKPNHAANYKRSLSAGNGRAVGFIEVIGEKPVDSLAQQDLTDWLRQNPQWQSSETRRNNLAAAFACFNWAANEARLIPLPPYRKTKRLREPRVRRRDATDAETLAILELADESLRRIIGFVDATGMRTCEARELRWNQIDWERGVIVFDEHKTVNMTSDGEARLIGLDKHLLANLRQWFETRKNAKPFVFLTRRGRAWTKNNLCLQFRKVRDKAGLADDLTPYCFRHRFGTISMNCGMAEREVADLMGHRDTKTTRRYSHTNKADLIRAKAEKLAERRTIERPFLGFADE